MGRRKKKRHSQGDVELNLAAMLDMAFQLLTFFILTFRPAPVEGQISLRLPPPVGVIARAAPEAGQVVTNDPAIGLSTLTIGVFANPNSGRIETLQVGEAPVSSIVALNGKLKDVFADAGNPFDQVIIQVNDACRYDELMKVVDICTQQKITQDGKKMPLSKLSFVEVPSS
jgi:biopolymer transport protein ExbD